MSQTNSNLQLLPQEAAARLIGFYPTITASDPEIYAAGLVHMFSQYPAHLVAEAVNPFTGLPSLHDYPPTMKQVKDFLEPKHQKEIRDRDMQARFNRAKLPPPPPNPEMDKRIAKGLQELSAHLKSGFGPSTQGT